MMRSMKTWTRVLGSAALGATLFAAASCGDGGTGSNPLGDIAKMCGLTCPDTGVAEGNASITGYVAVDSFFRSVVNFKNVAAGVTADIQAELDGIQGDFGLSDADVSKAGNLGAAVKAKLAGDFKAKLVVKAQPAKCEINASISAEVTAECQAKADCKVDPGKATFECMGTCTVDASVEGKCDATADIMCNVSGPQVACTGSCEGTCSADLSVAASCTGNCVGTCSGTCDGDTDTGAGCNGTCNGMCMGKCEVSGMAALDCKGSCNGSCRYKPAMASCTANAKVECDLKADAKAECSGRCDGDFEPPKADCDASASCEASAKADAKFQAKCTPPSIDIKFTTTATGDAKAQFDFAMAQLKVRLPRLSAAIKKAQLVTDAGAELGKDGAAAVKASVSAFASSDVEAVAKYRIATCAPKELNDSAGVVADSSKAVAATIKEASDVTAAVGM
jgi:hypothetical protein